MLTFIKSAAAKNAFVIRVWLFGLATVAVGLFIGFAISSVGTHLSQLRRSLNETQFQSIVIAEEFPRYFLHLNSRLSRYQATSETSQWDSFLREWDSLNKWIDKQKDQLKAVEEQEILKKIDDAFDVYFDAANRLHRARQSTTQPAEEIALFEAETDKLIQLGYDLAEAHQKSLQRFSARIGSSIVHLRNLWIIAFALLVVLSVGLWVVVYRDMIAPLHAKLIESHALLERQEKLASLGVLSAGLAHEIRNPLTAMKARLFTLGKRLEPGSIQEKDASVISREVDRLERILKDFLEFARPSAPTLTAVKAWNFLQEVRALLLPQLELQNIELILEPSVNPTIRIDTQQMTQVMLNLIRNAAESIGRNGSVSLRVREDSVLLGGKTSEVAVLEVTDTGKGISPEVEKRLFDPFHTTKDGGTGLGLSIAGRIVERHGGALRYKTRVGHGTTFGVVLPLAFPHERSR